MVMVEREYARVAECTMRVLGTKAAVEEAAAAKAEANMVTLISNARQNVRRAASVLLRTDRQITREWRMLVT